MSTANMHGAWPNPEVRTRSVTPSPRTSINAVVVGLGYVGLPTALSLAEAGIAVTGVGVDESRLLAIKAEQVDLAEPDHERLGRALYNGLPTVTTSAAAVAEADVVLISCPHRSSPPGAGHARADRGLRIGGGQRPRGADDRADLHHLGRLHPRPHRRTAAASQRVVGVADVRESPALDIMAEPAGLVVAVTYAAPHVPTLRLGETTLPSSGQVESQEWDLVIAHTVHPGCDPGWSGGQNAVLDTTYRLRPELGCAHLWNHPTCGVLGCGHGR